MRIQEIDYQVNLTQAILWQYSSATNLLSLINLKQIWYTTNQTQFWQNWYTNVFNLLTANAFGLSVWSYILNVPFYVPYMPEPANKPIWGFNAYSTPFSLMGTVTSGENTITGLSTNTGISLGAKVSGANITNPSIVTALVGSTGVIISSNATGSATESITFSSLENSYLNFKNGNFSTRGKVVELTLEEQRFLLRLRYFQLTTRGDITDINAFLNYLVSTSNIGYSGTIYALDGLDMTMTYVFTAPNINPDLVTVIQRLDLFPRPAGVGIKYVINTGTQWGFGPYNENFGHGNFLQEVS